MSFELTAKQLQAQDIIAGPARHIMLFGGSRSGKTFLHVRNIVRRAILAPGSRHVILRFRFAHVKASVVLDTFPEVMKLAFDGVKYHVNKTDWYAKLPGESEIWFGGLDDKERTEKILGQQHATIMLNECSQIPQASRDMAVTRLAQVATKHIDNRASRPLMPRMYYDCNPPSKAHWSYRLFVQKVDPETRKPLPQPDEYASVQMNPQDNVEHLPENYIHELEGLPARLRKRFLAGEFADATPNQLFFDETIEKWRVLDGSTPDFVRVVVAVDPSGSGDIDNADNDAIGIVVVALGTDGNAYVLEDCTVKVGPATWGKIAADAFDRHAADVVVGEVNYGGEMVRHTIQTARNRTPYKAVHATRGKAVRAEPIAALYEQGKCVGEGSLIALARGLVPVEQVRAGDMAWTRQGLRRVTWAGSMGTKETVAVKTASGTTLHCTADHPIWVENIGWIHAKALAPSDILLSWNTDVASAEQPQPGQMCSADHAARARGGRRDSPSGLLSSLPASGITETVKDIGAQAVTVVHNYFIELFGNRLTAQSLPAGMFIMSTATGQITDWTISRPCSLSTTWQARMLSGLRTLSLRGLAWQIPHAKSGNPKHPLITFASNALLGSSRSELGSGSVHRHAIRPTGIISVEPSKAQVVYDLTVAGAAEYFADGVLVHNCRHVGYFRELEDELTGFSTVGYLGERSPNRADALIWGLTELFPGVVAGKRERKEPTNRGAYSGAWQA